MATVASAAASDDSKVPVTVITGFLGSGKTTLLNRILQSQEHGKRIAVIENEFGAVGVDDALVQRRVAADEEIFEMNNGCICCTVRGDLIRILGKLLAPERDPPEAILIETTGLADPAPVAQTFFADADVAARARLDAIVTVVDAAHVEQHLDDVKPEGAENEAVEQLVFADRIVLNKMDLVTDEQAVAVEARIRQLNRTAPIVRCEQAKLDLDQILDARAFSLQKALEIDAEFMDVDGEHIHDETVTSVGLTRSGECDLGRLNGWISDLLQRHGTDLFRMKGVVAIKDSPDKLCLQGVHMMLQAEPLGLWADGESRICKLVFIGRRLADMQIQAGFDRCLVDAGADGGTADAEAS